MQLNELINNYSIQTVSQKTNIPLETLEKLNNKDWGKFRQVQAIGLLSVIEREFEVDLDEEKQECRAFFKEHEPKEANRPIDLVDAASRSGGGNSFVSIVLTLITLGAIGYGVWFYLNKNGMATSLNNNYQSVSESNDTNKTQIKNEEQKPKKQEQTPVTEKKEIKEPKNKKFDIISTQSEKNELKTDKNIDKLIEKIDHPNNEKKEEKTETILVEKEQNKSRNLENTAAENEKNNDSNETKFDIVSENKTQNNELKQTENLAVENNLSNNENNLSNNEDNLSLETKQDELENNKTNSSELTLEQTQNKALIQSAAIKPKVKSLWVGIFNLDNKKRVSKIIKKEFALNLDNGKVAIVTGHSKFDIITSDGVKSFDGKGKRYLVVSKEEGVKEITKNEYKALTKNRAW
jgi:hypothetical protein